MGRRGQRDHAAGSGRGVDSKRGQDVTAHRAAGWVAWTMWVVGVAGIGTAAFLSAKNPPISTVQWPESASKGPCGCRRGWDSG